MEDGAARGQRLAFTRRRADADAIVCVRASARSLAPHCFGLTECECGARVSAGRWHVPDDAVPQHRVHAAAADRRQAQADDRADDEDEVCGEARQQAPHYPPPLLQQPSRWPHADDRPTPRATGRGCAAAGAGVRSTRSRQHGSARASTKRMDGGGIVANPPRTRRATVALTSATRSAKRRHSAPLRYSQRSNKVPSRLLYCTSYIWPAPSG